MDTGSFQAIATEIVGILENGGQVTWSRVIAELSSCCLSATTERTRRDVLRDIRRLYGGMGSFNDLVLSDGSGHMLIEENERLDALRKALFAMIIDELTTSSSIDDSER